MRAIWMGTKKSPQYQETMVNVRSDAENETGNAKVLNVFFNNG
jgi:hypothetical protein